MEDLVSIESYGMIGRYEAHLLSNNDLESLRMLTNTDMDTGSHFAMLLIGQPTLRRRLKLAVFAALVNGSPLATPSPA